MDRNAINPLIALLRDDEKLLWIGKPNAECYLAQERKKAIPFFVGGSLLLWISSLVSYTTNGFAGLTVPLILTGFVFLLVIRLIGRKGATPIWWYAVTDQRILSDYPTEDAKTFWQLPLAEIHTIKFLRHAQMAGTISFNASFVSQNCIPFECIDDSENVYKIIEDARAMLLSGSARHTINESDFLA